MDDESPLERKNTGYERINWDHIDRLEGSPGPSGEVLDDGSPLRGKATGYEHVDWEAIDRLEASPGTVAALAATGQNPRSDEPENPRIRQPSFVMMPASLPKPDFPIDPQILTASAPQSLDQLNYQASINLLEWQLQRNVYEAERLVFELTQKLEALEAQMAFRHQVWQRCLHSWNDNGGLEWYYYRDSMLAGVDNLHYDVAELDAVIVAIDVFVINYWPGVTMELLYHAGEIQSRGNELSFRIRQLLFPRD